jgi:uncharacterized protein
VSERGKIEFPVEFPIKVMGRKDVELGRVTRAIIERHAGALREDQVRERPSAAGNFIAVTFTIEAQSQEQLDGIYRELTACEAVLMAL